MNIYSFTDPNIKNAISEAVQKAEKKTQGEIVPVIVGESDSYPGAQWRFGIFMGLTLSFSYFLAVPEHSGYFYLALVLLLTLLGNFLGDVPFLKRLALSHDEVHEEVLRRAMAEFYEQKVSRTSTHTGILIFVSLLEKRVILLADDGINAKVDQKTWEVLVKEFINDIKEKKIVEGFCSTIEKCGDILAKHFPPSGSNKKSELPNYLVVKPT